jgi:undecaprenyl-diphosphatase
MGPARLVRSGLVWARRPPAPLARHPWIGLTLALLGLGAFAVLVVAIRSNETVLAWDRLAADRLHSIAVHSPWLLIQIMRGLSFTGRELVTLLSWALALLWLGQRRWRELSMLALAMTGGALWFRLIGTLVDRPRPNWPDALDPLTGPGFPSGHSISAVLLYGLLAYLLLPHLRSGVQRAVVLVAAPALVLLIGFSRLFMGNHYPTDILAGYSIGLAWGALVVTAVERVFTRRA